ncbi:MAG: hypothetical protein KA198_00750, partial [Chitinophagaceae bacterium]|nr:hypothetical protein [Chitinophagaceae bacterium]
MNMILKTDNNILQGQIELPASKSISHRVMMIQFLAKTAMCIHHVSEARDTLLLHSAMEALKQSHVQTFNLEDAGTPIRFMLALVAGLPKAEITLTGTTRMTERPIAELVEALRELGAQIQYLDHEGQLPVFIQGQQLIGKEIQITGNVSSQFISALCLIAPTLPQGLKINCTGNLVSTSYIQMTLNLMQEFGVQSTFDQGLIDIPSQAYRAKDFTIESDWSSATFFYAMAMMCEEVHIRLKGLASQSVQGDAYIVEFANQFGLHTQFEEDACVITRKFVLAYDTNQQFNLSNYPDLAVPIIVACACKYPQISFTGLHHLELKESKRISALIQNLKKFGLELSYEKDVLKVVRHQFVSTKETVFIETFHDHRIAMAMCLLCLQGYKIELD